MTATNISPDALVGQTFDCVFGAFVPRLTFKSTEQLRVQATDRRRRNRSGGCLSS